MSFQNFDSFQNQHPAADVAATPVAAATADPAMAAQPDPTTAAFQGPAPGDPAAVPQPPTEGKTTLWYVHPVHIISNLPSLRPILIVVSLFVGWAS